MNPYHQYLNISNSMAFLLTYKSSTFLPSAMPLYPKIKKLKNITTITLSHLTKLIFLNIFLQA